MNKKQQSLITELKNVLEEIDIECINDDDFGERITDIDIFARNINDIVEDLGELS